MPRCAQWQEPHHGTCRAWGTSRPRSHPPCCVGATAPSAGGQSPDECIEQVFKQLCPGGLCPCPSTVVLGQASRVTRQRCIQRSHHQSPSGPCRAGGHECFPGWHRAEGWQHMAGRAKSDPGPAPSTAALQSHPCLGVLCSASLWSPSLNSPLPGIPHQSWSCPHP